MMGKKPISKRRRTLTRLALNIAALAFTIVPVFFMGQAGINYASATVDAMQTAHRSETIAAAKVSSDSVQIFSEPVVSITFDDGWKSVATNAAPILADRGIATTQYVITDRIGLRGYMSFAELKALRDAGHEIGSHSVSHIALAGKTDEVQRSEMSKSKDILTQLNLIDTRNAGFAYPYGSFDASALKTGTGYYATLRDSNGGSRHGIDHTDITIREHFDGRHLIGYGIDSTTRDEDLRAALDYAKAHNGWLILIFHQIDDTRTEYSVSPDAFNRYLDMIESAGIKTSTITDAMKSTGVSS